LDIPLVSDLEDKFSVHQEYLKLLKLTFSTPSPPHQLLAFAFCKLLLWRPQRFVGELSELALSQVEERFRGTLTREIPEEADTVRKALGELRSMLRRKFDEAIEDPSTRSTYSNLSTHVLGETKMKDYFKLRPEQNVSHWIYAVRRRTLAAWSRQC
jgi:hypothetical protein